MILLLFLAGLILVSKGGDAFVDAASAIARAFRIPAFIVGATVVSLATTLPELTVSLLAAANGQTDMAAGNAIGSVNCNTALILGLLILCRPCAFDRSAFRIKALLLAAAALTLFCFRSPRQLTLIPCLLLMLLLLLFFIENVFVAMQRPAQNDAARLKPADVLRFVCGIAAILIGARLLVVSGETIARRLHIPEAVIGATLIAAGTSLPELVTAISAIRKNQAALSVGNLIGANIIDLTLILPACTALSGKPLPLSAQCVGIDLPFCLFAVTVAVLPPLLTGRFRKWQGLALVLGYGVYLYRVVML